MGTKNAISILNEKIKIASVLSAEFFFEKGILRKFFNFIVFEYIGNIKIQKKMLAAFWTQFYYWERPDLKRKVCGLEELNSKFIP